MIKVQLMVPYGFLMSCVELACHCITGKADGHPEDNNLVHLPLKAELHSPKGWKAIAIKII